MGFWLFKWNYVLYNNQWDLMFPFFRPPKKYLRCTNQAILCTGRALGLAPYPRKHHSVPSQNKFSEEDHYHLWSCHLCTQNPGFVAMTVQFEHFIFFEWISSTRPITWLATCDFHPDWLESCTMLLIRKWAWAKWGHFCWCQIQRLTSLSVVPEIDQLLFLIISWGSPKPMGFQDVSRISHGLIWF